MDTAIECFMKPEVATQRVLSRLFRKKGGP